MTVLGLARRDLVTDRAQTDASSASLGLCRENRRTNSFSVLISRLKPAPRFTTTSP